MEISQTNEALARAIARYPSLKAFAGALNVRYQTVQQWLINGVPAEYCPRIEELSGGESRCEDLNSKVNWAYIRATQKVSARRATDPEPEPGRAGRTPVSRDRIMTVATDQPVLYERRTAPANPK